MDFFYVLMPIAGVTIFWPGLIILGIGVGIIGGFFGMGGAWMVTPGLNILGFPMAFAIGTDIAHMAGKSLISTMRHGKFGNVDYKLGIIMLVGTVVGFEVGAQMVMWLERIGQVEKWVRILYLVLLSLIAWTVFADVAKKKRKDREAVAAGKEVDTLSTGIEWHKTLHKIKIPPMVTFKAGPGHLHRLAAHFYQLRHRLAGGHPGDRRRSDPHAGLDLLHRLPHPRGGGHRPLRSHDLRVVRHRHLYLQGPDRVGGRHDHAVRRRGGRPDGHRSHQVHQRLRHPHRLRPGRRRLRPVHPPQDDGQVVSRLGSRL